MPRTVAKLSLGLSVVVAVLGAFMMVRPTIAGFDDVLPIGWAGAPWYLAVSLALIFGLLRSGRQRVRTAVAGPTWWLAFVTACVFCSAAIARGSLLRYDLTNDQHWPPRFSDNHAGQLDAVAPDEQAVWGASVALHRFTTTRGDPYTLPRTWMFPAGMKVAIRRDASGSSEIWARAAEGAQACVAQPAYSHTLPCDPESKPPAADQFRDMVRVDEGVPVADSSPASVSWPQYRRDAEHTAREVSGDTAAAEWMHSMHGPIRSTVSVAGNNVMVGTHGTGEVEILDLASGRSRWATREPNWIHMDIVSDGHVAIAGFGDNALSFVGRAPSGVSVYDLRTGDLRWTAFDESSVMTSPVLRDSVMVYSTSLGVLRKRNLRDGHVLAIDTLPGGAVMAPPAMSGDTVAFGLEPDYVCSVLISTLKTLWCRHLDGMLDMGHAAPAIHDGMVIASGLVSLRAMSRDEYVHAPLKLEFDLLVDALFPGAVKRHAGQRFLAFRLRDGAPLWQSPLFLATRPVDGHIAGTASAADSVAVIVLPVANVVVGFNPQSGRVRWSSDGHGARGPALLADGVVVVTGRDGVIDVRVALNGTPRCTIKREVGYDRAGPSLVGAQVILANMYGRVETIPASDLLECRATNAVLPSRATQTRVSLPPRGD